MVFFVIGGARSGKSSYALQSAERHGGSKAYIATAQALDAEMAERIERHRAERVSDWQTYEEPLAIAGLITELSSKYDVILLDCLTLWLSNLMMREADIESETEKLLSAVSICRADIFIVANEVGMGIVPENELGRRFRDLAGQLNRRVAEAADTVYLMAAGIPLKIK